MEQAPTTAPPKVKPGTTEKPGKSDPFKNPKHQPKPKAGKNMEYTTEKSNKEIVFLKIRQTQSG